MTHMKKWRTACLAAGAVTLGLLGLPSGASATCTPPPPPGAPTVGSDRGYVPPGVTAAGSCSVFDFEGIGRRH